ncbi:MAG: (Fe-S)-binding protein, partial [Chloroflexota bacterium]
QALMGRGEMVRSLPLFLSSWTRYRSLPKLAREPLSRRWQDVRTPGATIKAAFYAGCMIEYAYPEIGEAVAVALRKRGVDVSLASARGCCGYPALSAGDEESARRAAIDTLQALQRVGSDYVITACPTCSKALREEYPRLFASDPHWWGLANRIAQQSYDFSEFLVRVLEEPLPEDAAPVAGRAGYHDPCHLRHGLGVADEPRQLVAGAGYQLVELEGSDTCCGCAGLFSVKFPEVSQVMLQRKVESIVRAGVDVVATDCPACIMQIRGGLDKRGSAVKVFHTAQILAVEGAAVPSTDQSVEKPLPRRSRVRRAPTR